MRKKNKSTCVLHKILKGTSQYSFIVIYEEPFGKDIIYVNGLAPTFGYFHTNVYDKHVISFEHTFKVRIHKTNGKDSSK